MFSCSGLTVTGVFIRSRSCVNGRLVVKSSNRLCDVSSPVTLLPALPGKSRRVSTSVQMPQKHKTVKEQHSPAGGGPDSEVSGPVARDKSGSVTVTVHAKPSSKNSCITGVSAEAVGIAIAAPPTDGEANTELIRYLAEVLGLKKSHISLNKGSRSRDKVIRVDSSLSVEEVLGRLKEAAG